MINIHGSQLAQASQGEQWLQVYKRENEESKLHAVFDCVLQNTLWNEQV